MNKNSFLDKIDQTFTKIVKKIVGDDTTNNISVVQSLKDITQKNVEKIKAVGLKETLLTAGTPDEKDVLYKEVIKREKQKAKEEAKTLKEEEKERKKSQKKKPIKKTTSTKKKPSLISKKVNEKKSTETKKSSKKTSSEKKIVKEKESKKSQKKKPSLISKKQTNNTSTKKVNEKKSIETKKSSKETSSEKKTIITKTKKEGVKKTTPKKKSKRDEKIILYIKDIKKHYGEVDEDFVAIIVKNLGPSIYKKDSESVACSDPKELDTVRKNFLMKKLGINASQNVLDAAIQDVCTELKSVRTKYRATFYYALAKKFKKESVLS